MLSLFHGVFIKSLEMIETLHFPPVIQHFEYALILQLKAFWFRFNFVDQLFLRTLQRHVDVVSSFLPHLELRRL